LSVPLLTCSPVPVSTSPEGLAAEPRFSIRMPQVARGLRPVTTTTTQSASVKWALNANYVHFAVDFVRAGEELVGYVSLEEGVGCGVWRNG
jgi:hypothetical protein